MLTSERMRENGNWQMWLDLNEKLICKNKGITKHERY